MNKVTKFGKLSLLTLLVGLTGLTTLKAQDPTPIWSIDAPTGGWFTTDGTTRGLSFNPATGNLIAASRTVANTPVLINAATGDSVGVLNTTGITGGLIPYVFIQATADGQIFASNVVNNDSTVSASGGTLKIYHWANEAAEPTVIYARNHGSTLRVGDSFAAYGSGNNITLLMSGGSTLVVKITWDGTTATRTDYTVASGIARGGFSSQVNDSTVWITGTGTAPAPFDFKNGVVGAGLVTPDAAVLTQAVLNSSMTSDAFKMFGNSYLFLGPAATGKQFWLLNLTTNKVVKPTAAFTANANTNNNGSVVVDKANGRVYILKTNNVIQAYNLSEFVSAPKVFFSEYVEGSGNSKALEIYNGNADSLDLTTIQVVKANNGGTFAAATDAAKLTLEGKLAPGSVYVIANAESDAALIAKADTTFAFANDPGHQVVTFNGDDAVGLFVNGDLVDLIGDPNNDPGTNWAVAGTGATNEFTLVRKPATYGNPVALASFGTDAETSEWIVYPQNTFTYVGSHDILPKYNITFRVNMNPAIDSANFVPALHNVWVRGSFNNWGDSGNTDTLKDADNDGIYEITKSITAGNISYKFFVTSRQFQGGEWEPDPASSLNVTEDATLDVVAPRINFNNLANTTFDKVAIQFQLNMQVQILKGVFNKNTDIVDVRGNFNGWAGGTPLTEGATPNVFETVLRNEDFALGGNLVYKFTTTVGGATNWESPNNNNPDNNRVFAIEDREYTAEERLDGYIAVFLNEEGEAPFFSDITNNDIFTQEATVTFHVDLRPAFYFLADSAKLPSDVQTQDTTSAIRGLFANGPFLNTGAGGWETWGEDRLGTREDLRLVDDGTMGDEVAGDSIFARAFTFAPGRDKIGPYKFGINGLDNEAFAGENHRASVQDGDHVRDVYGAIRLSNGTIYKALYDPYIGIEEGTDRLYVRRTPTGPEVSVEDGAIATPAKFALSQNYPNPFNPSTTINFSLPKTANVTLVVYNVLGQKVATLVNAQAMTMGEHNFTFDASRLASGVYMYQIQAGEFTATKSMTLIK